MGAEISSPDVVTRLLSGFRRGDSAATGQLVEVLYPELRRLAAAKMSRERLDHTLQPTALVSELYLELLRIRALPPDSADRDGKSDFMAFAAYLMKRLLIHHARPLARRAVKVGEEAAFDRPETNARAGAEALAEIDSMMEDLARVDPKVRMVVELKVFGGLTGAEIARQLGCGTATVARHWSFGQQWLKREMAGLQDS